VAFDHFSHTHPDNTVLLIDTYDTEVAAAKVVTLADQLKHEQIKIKGVRLDSGDLAAHARNVRQILDQGGLKDTTIFASGNIDEYRLQDLISSGAPIDGFGIGTALDISSDAPSLDCAYKLQEYAGKACRKRSEGKATWPGRKQVYRHLDNEGYLAGDIVALEKDDPQVGIPLIEPVMLAGKRIHQNISLHDIRQKTLAGYTCLPKTLTSLDRLSDYKVEISAALQAQAAQLDAEQMRK